MCCGDRERRKRRESVHQKKKGRTLFREQKKSTRSLFFLYFALSQRERKGRRKEGQREESNVFSSFFFLRFFFNANCSLFFLSLPLFSLFSLSLSSSFQVCVFLLEFSPHEIELFGGGSHSHPIIVLIFPRYKSKQQQQHAKRAFYSVNARNKNRDTRARFKAESPRENCSTDDIRLL